MLSDIPNSLASGPITLSFDGVVTPDSHDELVCDLKKILARFGKKKLASLKAEMPINSCLVVRQLSTVWKKKVAIITKMEEETGHKYDKLEKVV